ncbi:MAG: CCA tRNA nucleotidyltransferase [Parachlamydiaceae bacterium]
MDTREVAIGIVKKLVLAGYTAYFAGGWVRDHLMGHPSEDIDIATDAPPEVILDLFPRTLLVGLAFGVVVVIVNGHQFEVATFRRDLEYVDGRKPTQIELATPEEDASRRDFTINGMFYDPLEGVIHDFVQGAEDLKLGVIRAIGDPDKRFIEDRLRMIRAIRFSSRFGFKIDPETETAIMASADTLFPAVAMERIWQEFGKMAKYPHFDRAILDMHRLGLLPVIFPALAGVHLDVIRKYVSVFPSFPQGTAPVLFLMQLFPQATLKDAEELCIYLHISNVEASLAGFFVSMRGSIESEQTLGIVDLSLWVQKYAHPAATKCLDIIASRMEKESFLHQHHERMAKLEQHIQRVRDKTPIVSAAMLQKHGIPPGKQMGLLIKEGERIAILHDFRSADEVLSILKGSHLWPKA